PLNIFQFLILFELSHKATSNPILKTQTQITTTLNAHPQHHRENKTSLETNFTFKMHSSFSLIDRRISQLSWSQF
ncbi:hypothetical protein VIGAN_01480900, partial [Vigna angularis var. angularis]